MVRGVEPSLFYRSVTHRHFEFIYTVDIVVGIIVGYWNFIWHLYVLRPNDMEVPVEQSTTRSNNGEINYGITDIKTV